MTDNRVIDASPIGTLAFSAETSRPEHQPAYLVTVRLPDGTTVTIRDGEADGHVVLGISDGDIDRTVVVDLPPLEAERIRAALFHAGSTR